MSEQKKEQKNIWPRQKYDIMGKLKAMLENVQIKVSASVSLLKSSGVRTVYKMFY